LEIQIYIDTSWSKSRKIGTLVNSGAWAPASDPEEEMRKRKAVAVHPFFAWVPSAWIRGPMLRDTLWLQEFKSICAGQTP